ncbi:MAG: T9SS type A sorting domain-containing protein [Salinivenus sp.]
MTFHARSPRPILNRTGPLALLLLLFTFSPLLAQSALTVHAGGTLTVANGALRLGGDLTTEGTLDATSGTLALIGPTAQRLAPGPGSTIQSIVVDKEPSSTAQLADTLVVTDSVLVLRGDLDLNGKHLDLGQTAGLRETAGNTITGASGTVTATRFLNAPDAANVGGLGARITSGANMSAVIVTRGHAPQTGTSTNEGIARYYDIAPAINTGLDATLEFFYDESELNGRDEPTLALWRSTNDGTSYAEVGGTGIASANVIALSGIDAFSRWTATSDGAPLPVELVSFTGTASDDAVTLTWETLSETGSASFDVERRQTETAPWHSVKTVPAAGMSDTPRTYTATDAGLPFTSDRLAYRLKQVDRDGTVTYTDPIRVKRTAPTVLTLHPSFPNPVRTYATLRYTLPRTATVRLSLYDVLGREVDVLVNRTQPAGRTEVQVDATALQSGLYFYRLEANRATKTGRLTVVR